jgi:hypothetical protein
VQDAFLGLTRARQAGTTIADPKTYLTTVVSRLGINYLSSARVRRETYVGDWLPEPVVVPAGGPGPAGRRAGRLAVHGVPCVAGGPLAGGAAVLVRRRQGAGDRETAGPAVTRHAAARRPAPPGPGPRRLDPAGLGRRPAERRVVRRQRARGQRGRARRGRRRGQAIRAVVNPGKLGHIGPVSECGETAARAERPIQSPEVRSPSERGSRPERRLGAREPGARQSTESDVEPGHDAAGSPNRARCRRGRETEDGRSGCPGSGPCLVFACPTALIPWRSPRCPARIPSRVRG